MLAYDSSTATSDNSQGQRHEAFFIEIQEKTQQWEKILGAFLAQSAFPEQTGSLSRANVRHAAQELQGFLISSFILEVQKDHQKTPRQGYRDRKGIHH